ncbi:MAG: Acetyltransferase (GNAT) family protein [Acidobacteria bacterium OLB17]|nr:MAG: Acetyltransferase (GNAT) family protein [Acidobacteria bacterium OLB17]MCZ2390375.1 GNAT family N-acetyltransferase [Acidobacteriota bacterium]
MTGELEARQFSLSDRDALLEFLGRVYSDDPRRSDRRFWEWHYVENAYSRTEDLPIWIALDGGRIVGHLAAIETEIKVGGEIYPTIWILDLIIDQNYRRRGIAKRLVALAEAHRSIRLGINTHEQHSPELLESRGWKIVASIPRYTKMLFPGNAYFAGPGFWKIPRAAANLAYSFRPKSSVIELPANAEIRPLERFDGSADALWHKASETRNCVAVRRSSFLNWQYFEQPKKRFDVLGYFAGDELLGYIVLYFRLPNEQNIVEKAAISDLLFTEAEPHIADSLIAAALELSTQRRAGRVVTDVLNARAEEALVRNGFFKTKSPLLLMVRSDVREDVVLDPDKWFVTRGDSDTTIFEHPNLP